MPVCSMHPRSEDKRGTVPWQAMSDPLDRLRRGKDPNDHGVLGVSPAGLAMGRPLSRLRPAWGTIEEVAGRREDGFERREGRWLSARWAPPRRRPRVCTGSPDPIGSWAAGSSRGRSRCSRASRGSASPRSLLHCWRAGRRRGRSVPAGLGRGVACPGRGAGPSAGRSTATQSRSRPVATSRRARDRARRASVPARGRLDPDAPRHLRTQMPGGVSQVRMCTDALVGLAKDEGIAVVLTGHVTKDGDLAGPRALEHAVDVVLSFEGDARSGLRVLSGGKNRFGAEGETAWFEMGPRGLAPIDPTGLLVSGAAGARARPSRCPRRAAGRSPSRCRRSWSTATGRPAARPPDSIPAGSSWSRPCSTERPGSRSAGPSSSAPSSGGIRVDDPACRPRRRGRARLGGHGVDAPAGAAFVGEVSLNGSRPGRAGHGSSGSPPRERRGLHVGLRARPRRALRSG